MMIRVWGGRLAKGDFDLQSFSDLIDERLKSFRAKMAAGKINFNIKSDQQRHIWGTKEFIAYGKISALPPSYVTEDPVTLVREYAGTAPDMMVKFKAQETLPREVVIAEKTVGKSWDARSGKYVDTSRFVIVYSRQGVHIYPELERK